MKRIAEFVMEASFLKHLQRSGYQHLGTGCESVAEHIYTATMIAFVLSQLEPEANAQKLLNMCLFHDLPETRTGDLNYIQKKYVQADENKALTATLKDLPFRQKISKLIIEYNKCETLEAKLAHDADQISLIINLKHLSDIGHQPPITWIPHVKNRIHTDIGLKLTETILSNSWDSWQHEIFP